MRQNQLILEFSSSIPDYSSSLQETLTESLWDTAKDESLHIILREPALLELARRQEPGVLAYCDRLLLSDDQEYWFSALKVLERLNTYDAIKRLLVICGYSCIEDRKIVMHVLARVLTPAHREGFRRILRSIITPGVIDVTGWSTTALSVLNAVCFDKGIIVETSINSLARSFKQPEAIKKTTSSIYIQSNKQREKHL
ncbi:MAG: hypothetical protein AM325_004805 [Candidatus Thorarchaeota archaeon SMTZ1-45]|nr:MAG: hypothetical protein AM325_06570 [Candidatus Thorarchaeota archaeon SMTZ1-45]